MVKPSGAGRQLKGNGLVGMALIGELNEVDGVAGFVTTDGGITTLCRINLNPDERKRLGIGSLIETAGCRGVLILRRTAD